MSSTTAITGRTGRFQAASTTVARTTAWAVNPNLATSSEWGDSDSEGYTNRAAGRRDATFTAEGKFDTGDEVWDLFEVGDAPIATLFMTETIYWDFPCALCNDFNLSVDVDTEEVVGWTSAWGADGKFWYPGEVGITSRSL